jgi:hypothetical protein
MFDGGKFRPTQIGKLTALITSGSTPRGGDAVYVTDGPYFTDHLIVLNEEHLRRILAKFSAYYNGWRPHVSLGKDAPDGRPIDRFGDIVAHAILGGLHHRYARI